MEEIIPVVPLRVRMRELRQWVKKNSQPRPVPKPPKLPSPHPKTVDDATLDALFAKLSQPKSIKKKARKKPLVNPRALTATPSARVIELSTPTPRQMHRRWSQTSTNLDNCIKVKPSAMEYIASPRIEELSKPKWVTPKFNRRRKRKRKPKKKEKPLSKRVQEMALPHVRPYLPINEFAFTVNPITLTYRPTKRIKWLAQPKVYQPKAKPKPKKKSKRKSEDSDSF